MNAIAPYRQGLVVGCECLFAWYWLADLCEDQGPAHHRAGHDKYPTAEADRGRHPGFPNFNVFAGGPGSLRLPLAVVERVARTARQPGGVGGVMNPLGLLFVGIGIFAACGAAFYWEWFMNHRKARFSTSIFGRPGARIFYGILGAALIVLGMLVTAGIVRQSR